MAQINPYGKKAESLLELLQDPRSDEMNVAERCKAAKISRTTYYQLLSNLDYQDRVRQSGIATAVGDVHYYLGQNRKLAEGSTKACELGLKAAGMSVDKVEHTVALAGAITHRGLVGELQSVLAQLKAAETGEIIEVDTEAIDSD